VREIMREIHPCLRAQWKTTLISVHDPAAGGSSKSLMVPSLSASFHWSAVSVAGKNSKSPIYILAEEELEVCGLHNYSIMQTSVCVHHIYT
jgi:hypothetical protein